jgi:hypothetical protein
MTRYSATSLTAVFVLPVLLSSCATVLNGRTQHIQITTDEKIRRVSVDDGLFTDSISREPKGSAVYLVRRSHEPGYSHWNYLALKDTTIVLRRFAPVPKGTLYFSLSPLPSVNLFSLKSPEGQSTPGGPLGLAVGVDYFYKPDRYISFSAGTGTSAFVDHIGNGYFNTGHTLFGNIMNNHVIGSFDLGYGLSFSELLWEKMEVTDIYTVSVDRSVRNAGIGLSFSAQYRITQNLRFSILYQPTLLSVDSSPAFGYQHYISAGFAWRWRIRR